MARIEANNLREARTAMKPHRELLKQAYRDMGYVSFYETDEEESEATL